MNKNLMVSLALARFPLPGKVFKSAIFSIVKKLISRVVPQALYKPIRARIAIISYRMYCIVSKTTIKGFYPETFTYLKQTQHQHPTIKTYEVVEKATQGTYPGPKYLFGGDEPATYCKFHPDFFVSVIPHATVLGMDGAVITDNYRLLWDVSYDWPRSFGYHHEYKRRWQAPVEISGTTAVLNTFTAGNNYYHWMFNLLPRLHLVRRSSLRDEVDRFLVGSQTRSFQVDSLKLLDVSVTQIISQDEHPIVRCERLMIPAIVDYISYNNPPPWACHFLRQSFLPHAVVPQLCAQRIFIDRSDAKNRRLLNFPEIAGVLENYGFTAIQLERYTFAEQVHLFSRAEVIIGAHGAGLTNIVFCPQGAKVVEIFPTGAQTSFAYQQISAIVGLNYRYMYGNWVSEDIHQRILPANAPVDFQLDPQELSLALQELERL
ncbi:hypothetical protein AVDCRST_MAG81-3861 [uncultured Synechococcales cyanobacterium]|uniref:Glycosyltransferase 61 catalytic domain-containing protein n=1 Tax=uncultured Synechococcales cyanobacterium TaxID=1936017 RepID=A0A6J4VRT0_9CYAN|nr:hypothetical protein AVDCRST_MAG81-3861 [uncultured Synechococcales cyanobacterium]